MDSIPSKRQKYDLKIISSPKPIHFSGKYSPQNWSLPKPIIDYITDYPSNSEVYQNMIKCCKYFFARNPILVFSNLYYYAGEWTTERTEKNLDLNNILCKFWITKVFEVYAYMNAINDKTASSIIPKIYQCDVTDLLLNNQMISVDELKILSSKVEYLHFYKVNVMDYDGSVFAQENLFKLFPKIKILKFDLFPPHAITSEIIKVLLKIQQFLKLDDSHPRRVDNFNSPFSFRNSLMEYIHHNFYPPIHSWWSRFCRNFGSCRSKKICGYSNSS